MSYKSETLTRLLRVPEQLEEIVTLLKKVNDYGEGTGYCDEADKIWDDADTFARMILQRCRLLKVRYLTTQEGQADKTAIGPQQQPSIEQILQNRHIWKLRSFEPWPAFDGNNERVDAHIRLEISVEDAINRERVRWFNQGKDHRGMDRELLLDYIALNAAVVIDETGKQLTWVES